MIKFPNSKSKNRRKSETESYAESGVTRPLGDGWLLTGCTGLVGRFVLRNLLSAGEDVCVLARRRRGLSATDRVESIVHHFENEMQRHLPRPVVVDVDIAQQNFEIPAEFQQKYFQRFPNVFHCAASLRFDFDSRKVEPLATNIDGTRNVLSLADAIQSKHIHHVSTAFVCGQTDALASEESIPKSRQFRNPYEYSKAVAERLVMKSAFETKTIYRPSIVIGRSRDGWANSFHTLYSMLRFARDVGADQLEELMHRAGISQSTRNNVVPVDWVADTICQILDQPQAWGKIYNLTSNHPVSSSEIVVAIRNAANQNAIAWQKLPSAVGANLASAERDAFELHAKVFMSYFHSDLDFDNALTLGVHGVTPAPKVDIDSLARAFAFAINNRFLDPTHLIAQVVSKTNSRFAEFLSTVNNRFNNPNSVQVSNTEQSRSNVRICLSGCGGGTWYSPALFNEAPVELYMPVWLVERLSNGSAAMLEDAVEKGLIQSDLESKDKITTYVEKLINSYREFLTLNSSQLSGSSLSKVQVQESTCDE